MALPALPALLETVRRTPLRARAGALSVLGVGLALGAVVGEPRIGAAIGGSVAMLSRWRPRSDGAFRPGTTAAGWRLTGMGAAVLAGVDAVGELLHLDPLWRVGVPGLVGLPLVGLGLWWAVLRPRRTRQAALDAALVGLAAALLAWEWVWEPRFGTGTSTVSIAVVILISIAVWAIALLVVRGEAVGTAEVALCVAGLGAYVLAVLLVEDDGLIMRSWASTADIAGHVLATLAVVGGQRQVWRVEDDDQRHVALMWLPAVLAVAVELAIIASTHLWESASSTIGNALHVALLVVLAVRVGQTGRRWRVARHQLEDVAHADDLTGLHNRAWLAAHLAQMLREGRVSAAVMLDIDRFKLVNDGLGHDVGDTVLVEFGERLRQLCPTHHLVRMGGDEFLVLLGEDDRSPSTIAAEIRSALSEPITGPGYVLRPAVSVGVASPAGSTAPDVLLRDADSALYRAKESGRDRVEVYDAAMQQASLRRLDIEHGLRSALARDQLSLVHQPIVDATSGDVVLVECLLRWTSPVLGAVEPAEFIPVADEIGAMADIGLWVLEEACRTVIALDASPRTSGVGVAVNVSRTQLQLPGFADAVAAIVAAADVDPGRLVIEVTEAALLDRDGPTATALAAVAAHGIKVAVDDFGTGYSALGYLPDRAVHLLKLDPSFVRRLGTPGRPTLLGIIIDMAHDLGLRVVAEGVETEDQRRQLRAMGCDLLEGHLIGVPAPLAVLIDEVEPAASAT